MIEIKELREDDFPDTEWVPNGYDREQIPIMSDDNFRLLVDEHNKLVDYVKRLKRLVV